MVNSHETLGWDLKTQRLSLLAEIRHSSFFDLNLGCWSKNLAGLKFYHSISLEIGTESQSTNDCRVLGRFVGGAAELSL